MNVKCVLSDHPNINAKVVIIMNSDVHVVKVRTTGIISLILLYLALLEMLIGATAVFGQCEGMS